MRIAILGPLQATTADGRPVDVGGGRLRALLARLALDAGRVVTTDALIDAMWHEPPAGSTNALQSLVSRLRRTLHAGGADDGVIASHTAGYRLALSTDAIDAHRFERLASAGRAALRDGRAKEAIDQLTEALELWRGPALADLGEERFVATAASRLEQLRLSTTEDRLDAALSLGGHADVVAELESLTAAHPMRERLCGLAIRALVGVGRQADALAAYERTRSGLADELGMDPAPELQQVHLAALRGELATSAATAPASAPSMPAAPAQPRQAPLPTWLTSFVGRDADIEALAAALANDRLVTLHGPGGAGKTRLANQAAHHVREHGPAVAADGLWYAGLASVAETSDLAVAVLNVLGLSETGARRVDGRVDRQPEAREASDRLVEALADKRALLVLDNCEHLVDGVARLAETLLGNCRSLRVLATSREPLGVAGERLYPVGPLELPPEDAGELTPDQAYGYSAVRLFTDRAAAARPGFPLDSANTGVVVEICRRLDGMPLAIELAAARVRALSPAQIAARLDDRFRLLTNGGRTALARHQTLRAVVEWSWELLAEPERALLRRLAVFSGGASLDAVEDVCAGPGLDRADVVDVVASLVDRSLVEAVPTQALDAEVRYRLLETVKAYAAERLEEAGETQTVREAHAVYYRDLVERAEPRLRHREQLEWMARLAADYDNVLAALRSAIEARDVELASRIVAAFCSYWNLRGHTREPSGWIEEVLALPDAQPSAELALLHMYHGLAASSEGDSERMVRSIARAWWMCRRIDRATGSSATSRTGFPVAAFVEVVWTGVMGGSVPTKLVDLREHANEWVRGAASLFDAVLAEDAGDLATRDREVESALRRFRALGERSGLAMALRVQSSAQRKRGEHAAAVASAEEALAAIDELGAIDDLPSLLSHLGRVQIELGDYDVARVTLDKALHEARRYGVAEATKEAYAGHGWLAYRERDLVTARAMLRKAREVEPTFAYTDGWNLIDEALVEVADGQLDRAVALLSEALAILHRYRDRATAADVAQALACVAVRRGQHERAAELLGISSCLRGTTDLGSPERAEAERSARDQLGDADYDRAFRQGAELERMAALGRLDTVLEWAQQQGSGYPEPPS